MKSLTTTEQAILLTGVTGYIGPHVALDLLKRGYRVGALVRDPSKVSPHLLSAGLKIFQIEQTFDSISAAIASFRPTSCIHLSTLFKAAHAPADIGPLIESNLTFSTLLVEALVREKVRNFLNVGTIWQHYESKAYSPVCLYAACKQAFEDILQYYSETTDDFSVLNLKLYDSYGPNDARKKLIPFLIESAKTGKRFQTTNGESLIDLVHIDDITEGFYQAHTLLAKSKKNSWESFTLKTGNPKTLKEIILLVQKIAPQPFEIEWNKFSTRPREMMTPWNHDPVLPGWQPKFDIESGLKQVLAAPTLL